MILSFINIRKVPREVLKTEGEARGFQPSRGTLRMLMNGKSCLIPLLMVYTNQAIKNQSIKLHFFTPFFLQLL